MLNQAIVSNQKNKFLKIVVFSILEALTIGLLWDVLFDAGHIVLAALATFLLIAIEHIFARNAADGKNLFSNLGFRLGPQAILGATEMVFWTIWRLLHERIPVVGPIIAVVVFGLLMVPQHNAEANVNGGRDPLLKRLFRSQGVTISFIEAITAMGWLLADDVSGRALSLIPLFIGLLFEHVVREFGEPAGANF
jgi:hypothetical protein